MDGIFSVLAVVFLAWAFTHDEQQGWWDEHLEELRVLAEKPLDFSDQLVLAGIACGLFVAAFGAARFVMWLVS